MEFLNDVIANLIYLCQPVDEHCPHLVIYVILHRRQVAVFGTIHILNNSKTFILISYMITSVSLRSVKISFTNSTTYCGLSLTSWSHLSRLIFDMHDKFFLLRKLDSFNPKLRSEELSSFICPGLDTLFLTK
jgi:hypothetical protein